MRYLELLINFFIFITSINLVFLKKQKFNIILSLISSVLCILSIMLGGYRLQMIPAYFLTFVILLISIICRFSGQFKVNKIVKTLGTVMFTLVLIVSIVFPLAFPIADLPKPQGSYLVGTRYLSFTDTSRKGIFTAPNDYRKLAVQVWYPSDSSNGKQVQKWLPNYKSTNYFAKSMGTIDLFAQMDLSKTNSYLNANLSSKETKYPIIIFSHGYGGFQGQNTIQMENLASHGYVVFSIAHTYEAFVSIFPESKIIPYSTERFKDLEDEEIAAENSIKKGKLPVEDKIMTQSVHIWSDDTRFVINQIEKINNGKIKDMFNNKLDVSEIGAMGHSLGGATSGQASIEDSRIKAFINMDGSPIGDAKNSIIKQPFMLMTEATSKNAIIAGYNPKQKNYITVAVNGASHYNFTDLSVLFPIGKQLGFLGSIDGKRQEQIVNDYTLSFFNKYIKGMKEPFIGSKSSKYPEVTVQRH